MDNPEKEVPLGTQDTGRRQKKTNKQTNKQKSTTQHRKLKRRETAKCWTPLYTNIHKNTIRDEPSNKQLEVKTNRTLS